MKQLSFQNTVRFFLTAAVCLAASSVSAKTTLWQIGTVNQNYAEFAVAAKHQDFPRTFPKGVDYTVGTDSPGSDWPYIHPSMTDAWAGGVQHPYTIRFECDPPKYALYQLDIHLVASHNHVPPVITLDINGQKWQYQTVAGPGDRVLDNPAGGNVQTYTTFIKPELLRPKENIITITTSGSWMLYDAVVFTGIETLPPLRDFEIMPQPCWYNDTDGVSRKFRLDFGDCLLIAPAQVDITTSQGVFKRTVNADGQAVSYVDVLAPTNDSKSEYVTVLFKAGQNSITKTAPIEPERKWEIYLVHQTHLDIGYTHTQPDVMNVQVDHIYKALDYIDQSKNRPEAETFKWHPEGMWAVEEFLNHRASEADKNRFIQATRNKTMHMDAMYAQAMTGIYSEEELIELMGAAKRYQQQYGVNITSAMQTDVPGYSWGLATAFGLWGVKYLNVGPNVGHRVGHTFEWGDKPFYWVSPCGQHKILFWMASTAYSWFHGCPVGHCITSDEGKILKYLNELKSRNYPYDMVNIRYNIGADNGPPNPALSECVHQWNTKYAYPKLIIAANSEMMEEFERRYGSQIPVRKKDFTPYWEDGCASTSADTVINRSAAEKIVQTQTLWSMLNAGAFPHEAFDQAWQKIIMYDEHTWGAHNSISEPDSAFAVQQAEYKKQFAVDAAAMTEQLFSQSITGIQKARTNTIDIFNTLNWPRTELVLISASDSSAGDVVKDDTGSIIASQRLSTGELAFVAANVPALGAKRYTIAPGKSNASGKATVSDNSISNGLMTTQWNAQNGAITSLTHTGIPGNLVDTAIGEGINDYLYILGRKAAEGHQRISEPVKVTVIDKGPLVAAVRITSSAPGCKSLDRVIRLVDGSDQLFITNTVDKLKVRDPESVSFGFPFHVPDGLMKINLQWGVMQPEADQIEGANKDFFCTRRWIDVSNKTYGVTWSSLDAPMVLFNPIAFSTGGWDKESYRTFIEPGQAFHSWVMNNHWETNYKADQEGKVTFRYALKPHTGGYDSVKAEQFGRALHQPMLAVSVNPSQPTITPLLQVQGDGIVVSTIEPSRDGTALMVRLYNSDAAHTIPVTVKWPGGGSGSSIWLSSPFEDKKSQVNAPFSMVPFEVVTLRLQKNTTQNDKSL